MPTTRATGALLGLAAAASFGVSAPFAKLLLDDVAPSMLAGLLYLGAGLVTTGYRLARPAPDEARFGRGDIGTLAAIVALGGVIAPVAMLIGLARVSAFTGSLLLNLEAPFTMGLAVLVFREHLGRRGWVAAALIVAGALALRVRPGAAGADGLGVLAIATACLCWAIDNNLTQRLSLKDPIALVRIKTLAAGTCNLVIAFVLGDSLPALRLIAGAAMLGAFSYGLSVVLDAYALRMVGAAREAAYFATAPFMGAVVAMLLFTEPPTWVDLAAGLVMALGVAIMLRDRHSHRHVHEPMLHEHAHVHDEHHRHEHPAGTPAGEPHTHAHTHEPLAHDHPHVSDLHHRHDH